MFTEYNRAFLAEQRGGVCSPADYATAAAGFLNRHTLSYVFRCLVTHFVLQLLYFLMLRHSSIVSMIFFG